MSAIGNPGAISLFSVGLPFLIALDNTVRCMQIGCFGWISGEENLQGVGRGVGPTAPASARCSSPGSGCASKLSEKTQHAGPEAGEAAEKDSK
jgi:hypothetical protein